MIQKFVTVQFGPAYAGYNTVTYAILNAQGTDIEKNPGDSIFEIPHGSGTFGALITKADEFHGSIIWNSGGENRISITQELNLVANASIALNSPSVATGGSGSVEWSYRLHNQNEAPVVKATVYVSSDLQGQHPLAVGQTDATGRVKFLLNPGKVFLWRTKPGYKFSNPEAQVVVVKP